LLKTNIFIAIYFYTQQQIVKYIKQKLNLNTLIQRGTKHHYTGIIPVYNRIIELKGVLLFFNLCTTVKNDKISPIFVTNIWSGRCRCKKQLDFYFSSGLPSMATVKCQRALERGTLQKKFIDEVTKFFQQTMMGILAFTSKPKDYPRISDIPTSTTLAYNFRTIAEFERSLPWKTT